MILQWYLSVLSRRPLLASSISTGVLMAAGDLISQTALEKAHKRGGLDLKRTVQFFGFGALVAGPGIRLWYATLEARLPTTLALRPVKMMLLDQSLFAPTFPLVFFGTMGTLKGQSGKEILDGLSKSYGTILLNNYKLWPAVQLINFYLVPLQYRVLLVNVVALGWNTYLVWKLENDTCSENTSSENTSSENTNNSMTT